MRDALRQFLQAGALGAAFSLFGTSAFAHHTAGSGQSESQRGLTNQGGDPLLRQRVALISGLTRSTDQPTLNPGTTASLAVLFNFRLHERFYVGAELPFIVVNEEDQDHLLWGYGDTRFGVRMVVSDPKQENSAWTVGINFSFPTRTVHYVPDPGSQWLLSPHVSYVRSWSKLYWFSMLHTPYEIRPSGSALDVGLSSALGLRLGGGFSLAGGVSADLRVLSVCREVDGRGVCVDGRATETDRPMGALLASAHAVAALELSQNWSMFLGGQVPLTQKRDVAWSLSLGVERRF